MIGHTLPHSDNVNGIRLMDRLKKHKHIKIEVWLDSGLAKYAKNSETYKKNYQIKEEISEALASLINQTYKISIHNIIFKDHYTANNL